MKENPKLKNICIKCGVDLYATEGRFECQKHPKECKGIYLSEETLLIHEAEQKQQLIDMMKADEELGLYEESKQECMITKIMQMDAKMAYDSLPKQQTLEEAAEYKSHHSEEDFIRGGRWQQERMYSEEDLKYAYEQGELYSYLCYGRTFENVLEIIKIKKK